MGTERLCATKSRRRFVVGGLRLIPTLLLLPTPLLLTGCQKGAAEDTSREPLSVPLASLPIGERVRLENDGAPVEVIRTTDGVTARSLLCTHQGCRVRWFADRQLYICPCHEGKFNAAGEVVYGMPTRPLRSLQATVEGDRVVITG